MKKFSELKFKKVKMERSEAEFTALIRDFKEAETFEIQNRALLKVYKYMDEVQTNFTIGEVKYTQDTKDVKNVRNRRFIDENSPLIQNLFNAFNKELVHAKFRDELEKKWGTHLFKIAETALECFDSSIIGEIQEINKLSSEYTALLASCEIEFNGEICNLSRLSNYAQNERREVRREASILLAGFFEKNNDQIGKIYDRMVKTRTQMAKKLGYENFIEMGYKILGRTDYGAKEVKGYREQIYRDLVPFTDRLFLEQAKRIQIENPQFYDHNLSFLSGNPRPQGDTDFMIRQAKKMYEELSPETGKFFSFLVDNELMDLETRPGKSGGGYMTYLPKYKAPFIFSNFNGTSGDVDVLTHEFGHAFQGYMSRNIRCPDYRSPTLEACEIHSMSMEFLTYDWMDLFFGDQADKYRYAHLSDAINFIPYGAAIDEFQHWVYENPEVSHEERCARFREIEKKYLSHRRYDDAPIFEKGGWWMRQSHIFSAPFYYIDYTLAQVVAFQFFVENEKNHEKAWKKYVRLCRMGGKYPFVTLLKKAGLRNPFEDGNVRKGLPALKKYLESIDISGY